MAGLEGMRLGNCLILRRIGGGGMGDIYLAEQQGLGRQVAIKVVRGEGSISGPEAFNEQATQQFLQEAQAIAALEHPNILPLYDYGEQAGIHYLVMQYVPQGSLADILEAHSAATPTDMRLVLPAPPALTAEIIAQTAAALQYAHDRGVIHRDVKPQNLLMRRLFAGASGDDRSAAATIPLSSSQMTNSGVQAIAIPIPTPDQIHVLLADFGLARFMSAQVGRTGTAGTPLYNAPEQYSGYPVPATDQYALACVAYLLLTGRPVFEGNLVELHHQHLTDTPAGVTRYNPHLPPAADTVLLRALAKDPNDRYPHIRDFATALRAAVNPLGQGGQTPWPRQRPLGEVYLVAPTITSLPQNNQNIPDPIADTRPSLELPVVQVANYQLPGQGGTPVPSSMATPGGPTSYTPYPSPVSEMPNTAQSLPPFGIPAPNSQRLSAPPPTRTPSGSSGLHTDARPAQLPAAARRRGWLYDLLSGPSSLRWKLGIIGLVAVILLGSIGTVVLVVSHHGKQTANVITYAGAGGLQGASQTMPRLGTVDLTSLKPINQAPSNQGHFSARIDTLNAMVPLISTLPTLTAPSTAPNPQNFLKSTHTTLGHITQTDVGVVAPMSVSAQGNDQFLLQVVDGMLRVQALQNAAVLPTQRYALADIFASVLHKNDQLGEARVFYDSGSKHWVLVANELAIGSDDNANAGYFDIAVSQSVGQIAKWNVYQINTALGGKNCTFADNPQLGNDDTMFYLTGTELACGARRFLYGTVLWVLPKAALTQGQTATDVFWSGFNVASNSPAEVLTPTQEQPGSSVELLSSSLSGYVEGTTASRLLRLWAVVQAPQATAPAQRMSIVATTLTLPEAYADPVDAKQPGTDTRLSTGDARISSAVYSAGHLYLALTTAVNWAGENHTRTGVYWLDVTITAALNARTAAAANLSATIAQSGIYGFAGGYVFDPSLAVDATSHLVLVANISSLNIYPSFVLAQRTRLDLPNTLNQGQSFSFMARGLKNYTVGQWGDYTSAYYSSATNSFIVAGAYTNLTAAAWSTNVWQVQAS